MEELFEQTNISLQKLPLSIQRVQETALGDSESEKVANGLIEQVLFVLLYSYALLR